MSESLDSLPVFFQYVLYFCGGCLVLVLAGLCIIAFIMTVKFVVMLIEDLIDDLKGSKDK